MQNSTFEIDNLNKFAIYSLLYISIQTIVLNSLNTVIILFLIKNKTFSNVLFLLMSINDFLNGAISVPGEILSIVYEKWPLGKPLCLFFKTIDYSSSSLSLVLLLVITTHRYIQLKDPFKRKEAMNRRRWLFFGLVWVMCYLMWFIIWYIYFIDELNIAKCQPETFNIYFFIVRSLEMILPFLVILVMNVLLIRSFVLIKRTRRGSKPNFKKQNKAIYCVVSITINVIVCWTMFLTLWPINKLCDECVPAYVNVISDLCNYLFSALNPIILLHYNSNYRNKLKQKLAQMCCTIK